MPGTGDGLFMLSTRIPKELRRRMKVRCAESGTMVRDFVEQAFREKLARERRRHRRLSGD